jgi:hypothetical protein
LNPFRSLWITLPNCAQKTNIAIGAVPLCGIYTVAQRDMRNKIAHSNKRRLKCARKSKSKQNKKTLCLSQKRTFTGALTAKRLESTVLL